MTAARDRDAMAPYEGLIQAITDMVRRGKVHLVTDTAARQRLQVETVPPRFVGDDPRVETKIEYAQPYGFKSVPRAPDSNGSAEAVCLLVAGEPDHPLVVAVTDVRDRPTGWASGDAGLYDYRGNLVRCQAGKIEIEGKNDIILGTGATKGVARTTDAIQGDAAMGVWMGQVQTFINGIVPGTIAPLLANVDGTVTGGSATVKAKD